MSGRRTRPRSLILLIAVLSCSCGCTRVVRERELFHPSGVYVARAERAEPVRVERPDGVTLAGWLLNGPAAAPALIYCPGNAETVAANWSRLCWLRDRLGVSVLAMDYRGFGVSGGEPRLRACADDQLAAYDWLRGRLGDQRPIAVYGRSIGAGMASMLAAERPVAALVLEAPPRNAKAVIRFWSRTLIPWYARWFLRLEAEPALVDVHVYPVDTIARVRAPLLILHGDHDTVIPCSHGQRVYALATTADKTLVVVPGATHDDIGLEREPVATRVAGFIARTTGSKP